MSNGNPEKVSVKKAMPAAFPVKDGAKDGIEHGSRPASVNAKNVPGAHASEAKTWHR